MKQSVIIVAGGKGLRMGSDLPKQFLPVGGKPVLMRTLEAFRKYDAMLQIILVLPREQQDFWKQLCEEHHFSVEHLVADGGETRFHSVKNGLALVEAPGLVGVHDGVRPFVSLEVIRRCYKLAEQHKAVIPVVDVVETLRHLTDAGSEGLNLQFCNTVINYDLPWNPMKIEQRIGRCHRYGQKNDVVAINLLNTGNQADMRVYEILSKKFELFDGVFGSSDIALGILESGINFEQEILAIYQKCNTAAEIKREFDKLDRKLMQSATRKLVNCGIYY